MACNATVTFLSSDKSGKASSPLTANGVISGELGVTTIEMGFTPKGFPLHSKMRYGGGDLRGLDLVISLHGDKAAMYKEILTNLKWPVKITL